MMESDEAAIRQLVSDLDKAWQRGDADAYGARFRADGTFTNVNGTYHSGRQEFVRRHADVFHGPFKGTRQTMAIKNLRMISTDVAVVDVDTTIIGCQDKLEGAPVGGDSALRSSLLIVLVKDGSTWWISAYHNVWRRSVQWRQPRAHRIRRCLFAVPRQRLQQLERFGDRALPHTVPADLAVKPLALDMAAVAACGGEMHKPDGLLLRAAARTGDTGDRHCEIGL